MYCYQKPNCKEYVLCQTTPFKNVECCISLPISNLHNQMKYIHILNDNNKQITF